MITFIAAVLVQYSFRNPKIYAILLIKIKTFSQSISVNGKTIFLEISSTIKAHMKSLAVQFSVVMS